MRSFLALGLLITLCASASAASEHHSRHHVIVHPSQGYAVPGWTYAAPRPPLHYDDTPSYNDPSSLAAARRCRRHPEASSKTTGLLCRHLCRIAQTRLIE